MTQELVIGIVGTIVLLGFILNGLRLVRGPQGHAFNAGALHVAIGTMALPVVWMAVLMSIL
jgi:L-aminopeptidase/D-esterase-like protein